MIITVYYKIGCPYCENTKNLIKKHKLNSRKYDVNDFGGLNNVISMLKINKYKIGNHQTVPIIFADGQFIGGNDEFETFLNKNIT